jgi:hypothetical protein
MAKKHDATHLTELLLRCMGEGDLACPLRGGGKGARCGAG